MVEIGLVLGKVHWSVWAVAPIVFAALYRKHGGFYYRSFISIICLAFSAIFGMCAAILFPLVRRSDLTNWSVARLYYHLTYIFLGVSVKVEGAENLKVEGPAVYVCNHQSSMDVFVMGSVFPKATSVVAKKAIKYYPILGWYMTLSNAIFLDRKNRDSAVKEAQKASDDIHRKNTNVWLFPEGTRGHESEITMLPFKKGAFYMAVQAQVPIVPIVVANYSNIYSSKRKEFKTGVITVRVLPPIPTKNIVAESEAVDQLATATREKMLVALREISVDKKSQ
ncbi:hypothetical protein CLU79DRAFT_772993 [Phycomyces nitens]|nr:hypothetical protein CLU79DRAFT_772993 [Phycomyces nitens]